MAPVIVLDQYYLAITFLISLGLQGALFAICFGFQTDKLTDLGGSINFFIIALFTLLAGDTFYARNIVASYVNCTSTSYSRARSLMISDIDSDPLTFDSVFVMVWSFRLGAFLFYRVMKTGKDGRFDEMRSAVTKLGGFFLFQLFWCWTVSLPLTILNSPAVSDPARGGGNVKFGTASDIIGIILWVVGYSLEVMADSQKFRFKFNNPQKGAINDKGVWGWSRHPNYAGEIILWWGMYALCIAPATHNAASPGGRKALIASVVGPIFISRKSSQVLAPPRRQADPLNDVIRHTSVLLYFVSGLPQSEKPTQKKYYLMSHGLDPESGDKWAEYKAYLNRTSILFPLPPAVYRPLPKWVKQYVLFDAPMYRFDEHEEGKEAVEEQRKNRAENDD
ncbi:BQ2448_3868 [Microbotryum intermedium]|uniref:BQ2448_3868 protein n=1 Tax=Microbotryum intermedium TaxID=269621 RepID=A0A238FJK0_9BASI|nr:BQ2448_3868 [Microbotryum intermedium]